MEERERERLGEKTRAATGYDMDSHPTAALFKEGGGGVTREGQREENED